MVAGVAIAKANQSSIEKIRKRFSLSSVLDRMEEIVFNGRTRNDLVDLRAWQKP